MAPHHVLHTFERAALIDHVEEVGLVGFMLVVVLAYIIVVVGVPYCSCHGGGGRSVHATSWSFSTSLALPNYNIPPQLKSASCPHLFWFDHPLLCHPPDCSWPFRWSITFRLWVHYLFPPARPSTASSFYSRWAPSQSVPLIRSGWAIAALPPVLSGSPPLVNRVVSGLTKSFLFGGCHSDNFDLGNPLRTKKYHGTHVDGS